MYRYVLPYLILVFFVGTFSSPASAQEDHHHHAPGTMQSDSSDSDQNQSAHDMTEHSQHNSPKTFIDEIIEHSTSGTSAQPNSAPQPMIMRDIGDWMFMFHNEIFFNLGQQSGPAG